MSEFRLIGGQQLQARLTAIGKAPPDMLREIAIRGVAEAKHLVPRKTGNLGRTIRLGSVTATYAEIRAGGTQQVGYAMVVEHGSRPHIIEPRRAKILAWGGQRTLSGRLSSGSKATNFARRVHHPGTKAQPFLSPGLEKALSIVGLAGLVERWNRAA